MTHARQYFSRTLPLAACCLLASGTPALGQSTFATIQGTVLDPSGAAIPEATVTVTDEGTGSKETSKGGAGGEYRIFDLNAGTYTITFSGPGFSNQQIMHQVVLARKVLSLDAHLAAGSVATEVEVKSSGALTRDDATVSHSLSSADINTVALNFRATDNNTPLYVSTLTPGVQTDPSGNISVAGGFSYSTSYSIDGISTVNARFNGPNVNLFPSVEAISEFKVNSANNDAEFGNPSDITVTTKAGTSQLHGGIYEFLQNSALNASNPVTRLKPKLTANDFGGYISGPVFVPHLDFLKSRAFFFFDYKGTRRPEAGSIDISVPSDAFRAGDLSAYPSQLFNPRTGQPYPNNQIPVNPSSAALLNAVYPHANLAGNVNNYVANFPGDYTLDNIDIRIDENFTERHRFWARFGGKNVALTGTDGTTTYDPANGTFSNQNKLRNVVASYSWTLSPSVVNELRGGYSLANTYTGYPLASQGSAILAAAGLTGLPAAPSTGGVPALNFNDGSFVTNNSDGRPHITKNFTYNINDSLVWAFGKHAVKFGFDVLSYRFQDYLAFTNGDQYGDYGFSGAYTGGGSSFADFLVGLPAQTDFSQDGPDVRPFSHSLSFYAQDSWKLRPNLTVDYGLRYQINAAFNDATNQLANFEPNFPGGRVVVQGQQGLAQVLPVFAQSIGSTPIVTNQVAGLPTTLRNTYYGDVDPRLGFTWQPYQDQKNTPVVHAGFGVYTVPVLGSVLYSLAGVATSNFLLFPQTPSLSLQFPNAFPSGGGGGTGAKPDFRRANQIDLKDPRELQWNAQIEQSLGYATVLRLSYTGSHTTQLIQSPDLNQVPANTLGYAAYVAQNGLPYPNFNAVLTRCNGPSAKYNAATVEVERRYVKGLTLDANYVWAKDTSNALGAVPTTLTAENGATELNRFGEAADYGNVIFVRRNRFVGTFEYELPFGRGQHFAGNLGRGANLALGGWSVAGIQVWQSGPFLTPSFSGTDPSGTGVLVRASPRRSGPMSLRECPRSRPTGTAMITSTLRPSRRRPTTSAGSAMPPWGSSSAPARSASPAPRGRTSSLRNG